MYKIILSSLTLLIMLAGANHDRASAQTFSDVSTEFWAADEISYLSDMDIINGYEDGSFRPNQYLSKYQAALMFARALELDPWRVNDPQFTDVPQDFNGFFEIARLVELGIIERTEEIEEFKPFSQLPRYEMAQYLTRAFELNGEYLGEIKDITDEQMLYVGPLASKGITSINTDDPRFKPENGVTRAQFSVFMARVFEEKYRLAFPTAEIFVPEADFFMPEEEVTKALANVEILNEVENFSEKSLTFLYEHDRFVEPVEMTMLFVKNNLVSISFINQSGSPFEKRWSQETVEWLETIFNQTAIVDEETATVMAGDIAYQVSEEQVRVNIDYSVDTLPNKDLDYIRGGSDWDVFKEYVFGPNPPPAYYEEFGEYVKYRENVVHVHLDSDQVEYLAQFGEYYNSEVYPDIEEEIVIYFYDTSVKAAKEEGYHAYYRNGFVYYGEELKQVREPSELNNDWREISLTDLEAENYLDFGQSLYYEGSWNLFTRAYIPHFSDEVQLARQTLYVLEKDGEDTEIFYFLRIADRSSDNYFAYYRDGKLFIRQ
ncbi:S-layer homology domain-containing protein [Jeotgalibacillus salarius]|uniref:S-layer homology domain-containing protein n=1 Tax=Jeotgalibacillus salarius TaxID=546023 RepID=A0A4Y8LM65_9BACL|nr:S-layer homology domain-containing protein [Jeotgalibacillus salarius]TFE04036.1 S-layer homology domain-containing protein [Jeotgalibacillus salarius]